MVKKRIVVLLLSCFICGCSSLKHTNLVFTPMDDLSTNAVTSSNELADFWARVQTLKSIDIPDNYRVAQIRNEYLKHPLAIYSLAQQAGPYIPWIVEELIKRKMPIELAFIPMQESSYDLDAQSPYAAGLWQLSPETARENGLVVSKKRDDRFKLLPSTQAALDSLEALNKRFDGDWLLTLAAYNSGGGRIHQAMMWNQAIKLPQNYWALKLPDQTMDYVPRILALADIFMHYDRYGIKLPPLAVNESLSLVKVKKSQLTQDLSNLLTVRPDNLLVYDFVKYRQTPLRDDEAAVILPSDLVDDFKTSFKKKNIVPLDDVCIQLDPNPLDGIDISETNHIYKQISDPEIQHYLRVNQEHERLIYQVKSGDVLSTIAKHYRVSVSDILAWNHLQEDALLHPKQQLVMHVRYRQLSANELPVPDLDTQDITQNSSVLPANDSGISMPTTPIWIYYVAQGDNLSNIAEHYHVHSHDLMLWNNLSAEDILSLKQPLIIYTKQPDKYLVAWSPKMKLVFKSSMIAQAQSDAKKAPTNNSPASEWIYYVKSGDSLYTISNHYHINVNQLLAWNNLSPNSLLQLNQMLRIYTNQKDDQLHAIADVNEAQHRAEKLQSLLQPWVYHVKAGDSLYNIRDRYHVSLANLMKWNQLTSDSVLHLKQPLTIYTTYVDNQLESSINGLPQKFIYQVQSGDTSGGLAQRYHISESDLLKWNHLNKNELRSGQKLVIYTLNPDSKLMMPADEFPVYHGFYHARIGDSLYKISSKYQVSEKSLEGWNNIDCNTVLRLNQTIEVYTSYRDSSLEAS